MPDMEKVLYGLECISGIDNPCNECAYSDKEGHGRYGCNKSLHPIALIFPLYCKLSQRDRSKTP